MKKYIFSIITALVLFQTPVLAQQDDAEWKTVEDHWYELELAGAKAGWMNILVETDGDRFRTTTNTKMAIGRRQTSIEVKMKSAFTETKDGEPVRIDFTRKMAQQAVKSAWIFQGENVKVITRQGGREIVDEKPTPPGDWLTPMEVERYTAKRREAGVEKIEVLTLSPEAGFQPVTITSTLEGEETIEHDGRDIPVTVWKSSMSHMPQTPAIEKFSEGNVLIYGETKMPFGTAITRLSSEAAARENGNGEAPELLVKTFVKPSRPISDPYNSTAAKLNLRVREGDLPVLPSSGAQRVTMSEDGRTATLAIDINDNVAADETDSSDQSYNKATTMIDGEDSLIQKLATKATRNVDSSDPMAKAEALRDFANKHISKKGLKTAFASASETARTRTGDCSEHAVLLAALMRAEHIPARVASGLVYADQFAGMEDIFGWHMWTQALIDGKWVDFDATLPTRYNAAHVLTGVSSLGVGEMESDLSSMMMLMGNLEIEVVDVEHD